MTSEQYDALAVNSRRDYFAAAALTGLLAADDQHLAWRDDPSGVTALAQLAFQLADAMEAQRK